MAGSAAAGAHGGLLVAAPAMRALDHTIERASRTLSTVLVTGETGVGKERVAQEIHRRGRTAEGPFVAVNCAALPAELAESLLFGHVKGAFTGADRAALGKLREADGGTLFLDEVGELPAALQAKLLRVLQEREVEPLGGKPQPVQLRVVAATHRDLETEVAAGRFREDLWYRLRVLHLHVPPLRERPEDVPVLAQHLLARVAARVGVPAPRLAPEVLAFLAACRWPGNVRELENLLEESVVMLEGEVLDLASLPRRFRKQAWLEDFRLPAAPSAEPEPAQGGPGAPEAPAPPPPPQVGPLAPPGESFSEDTDLRQRLEAWERFYLVEALARADGRKKDAAEALGLSPRAMSYYVRKHDL